MKAILCKSYGPPENLELAEIEKPEPGPNEVLIKVHSSAINDYDWSMVRGKPYLYRLFFGLFRPKRPVPGMELSGTIETCGQEVRELKAGDAVYGDISDYGFGTLAEYVAINEKAVIPKPDFLSFEDAAALSHAANLAWQGLVDVGNIRDGMNLLINGGGGGVGTHALQIAKTYNCIVTGVDTGPKLENMKTIGFDRVIDYRQTDFTKLTDTYDLILDAKTTHAPRAYLRALNPGGKYVTVGGTIPRLLQLLPARKILKKPVYMVGLKANKDLPAMMPLVQSGTIKPSIDGPYPIEKTPWAIQYFGEGKHHGKVIVSF